VQVFFDVSIGGTAAGRISIGLFGADVPKVQFTVVHFLNDVSMMSQL
jgi:hypothetical protein